MIDTNGYLDKGSCQSLSSNPQLRVMVLYRNFGKTPTSEYHTTKAIDCSPVSLNFKLYMSNRTQSLVFEFLAVPDLNMKPVNTIELNKL